MVTMQAKGGIFGAVEAHRVAPGHGVGAATSTAPRRGEDRCGFTTRTLTRTRARRWRARCGWFRQASAEAVLWRAWRRGQEGVGEGEASTWVLYPGG